MKKFILAIFVATLFALPTANALGLTQEFLENFKDVDENETYNEGILFLKQYGVVKGDGETGEFKPDRTLNRAEMLKILIESIYSDSKTFSGDADPNAVHIAELQKELKKYKQKCFDDIDPNAWYAKYVCYAKYKGWIVGYLNGKVFRPSQEVNFVESLKMALQVRGIPYTEDPKEWYKPIVEKAAENNFIPPDVKGFDVKFKRNQMADMVTRMIKKRQGELDEYLEEYEDNRTEIKIKYEDLKEKKDYSAMLKKVVKTALKPVLNKRYMDYNDTNYKYSLQNGRTILFFYVENCDACNTIDKQLKEEVEELATDVRVLKVNYDKEADLKTKYGILTAATLVLLNSDGNESERWTGGDLDTIKSKVGEKKKEEVKTTSAGGAVKKQVVAPVTKAAASMHIVEITADGFSPNPLTIKKGDVVSFINKDSVSHWPATDNHPTHTLYPGSSIEKCGTGALIFDSCKALTNNMMFEFTVKEAGIWPYHDHLSPSTKGIIIAE